MGPRRHRTALLPDSDIVGRGNQAVESAIGGPRQQSHFSLGFKLWWGKQPCFESFDSLHSNVMHVFLVTTMRTSSTKLAPFQPTHPSHPRCPQMKRMHLQHYLLCPATTHRLDMEAPNMQPPSMHLNILHPQTWIWTLHRHTMGPHPMAPLVTVVTVHFCPTPRRNLQPST